MKVISTDAGDVEVSHDNLRQWRHVRFGALWETSVVFEGREG